MIKSTILSSKAARQCIKGWPSDPAARVVAPIVEGQVRSFINDHPEMITPARGTSYEQIILSLSKRIINDLLCAENRARLDAALDETLGSQGDGARASRVARAAGDAGYTLASPAPADMGALDANRERA